MNCSKCGKDVIMPFRCPYCGEQFCSEHRLPENHQCPNLLQAQAQRRESVSNTTPTTTSYEYKFTFGQPQKVNNRVYMGYKEIKHLSIAVLLVIGIGISIVLYSGFMDPFSFRYLGWSWITTSVFALILTISFLAHELLHKVAAQKRGMWAEFRLTTWGALLTAASVILPFKFISPGAVMISGNARLKDLGEISIAGPSVNIILCAIFLCGNLVAGSYEIQTLCIFAAFINALIAIINLIPFGILDGYKIFSWNKKIWAASFAITVSLAIPVWILYSNMFL
ncbi:MAG: hypothetical protein GX638_03390 [Crenarchaeota archaeon]|nr:hypothetical protein [Thermoproteota archaeon]